jgi:phosphatidylserine decarboxylase
MSSRLIDSLLIGSLRLLPRNAISRAAGRFFALRLPGPLQRWEIKALGRAFGVDFSEVREPIDSFRSFQDFFVRKLVEGARPVDPTADAFVSPCDGAWGQSGIVKDGTLLQIKGRPYSVGALLGDDSLSKRYEGGAYATLYLSPRDYHRFHSPCDARVVGLRYLPGTLWPVNRPGVEGIDGLFAQNERIAALMDVAGAGQGEDLCIVAVGATMVGKVRVDFDEVSTNLPGASLQERRYDDRSVCLAKGEEWGRFEFGSTLVLVAAPGLVELHAREPGTPLRLGQRIGSVLKRGAGEGGSSQ